MSEIEISGGGKASGSGGSGGLTGEPISGEKNLEWGKAYTADASGGSFKVNLPPATGNSGKTLVIKVTPNSGANIVTLTPAAGEQINKEEAAVALSIEATFYRSVTVIAIANNPEVF
jgi:hypothetical protein